ncbi:OmpA family protein [Enterobacter sichuanensis]|uniref:OmpA family protein n=1 Tax=Enterobacter sichuanensis TaxID=2071710 RepID=UPI0021CE3EDB|nr:OmpA family protein [Enterobacter sichuanensis]MCU6194802.1 OmpA family protein [Enterobacter sichuanensis]
MNIFNFTALSLLTSGLLLFTSTTVAEIKAEAYGESYQSVNSVASSQSQIIYYRTKEDINNDPAMVYIDGEYHASLLPGMFTTLCVVPGDHSIGGYRNDSPQYKGKHEMRYSANFKGGATYFLKVDEHVNGLPVNVSPEIAEKELQSLKSQKHTLSRASAVVACKHSESKKTEFVLTSDVLFGFGKFRASDITDKGKVEISKLIQNLKANELNVNEVQVIGHTDAIGSEKDNIVLGKKRADTVRELLIGGGIPAHKITSSTAGSHEPVVTGCSGSKSEKIQCNAPNRRVVIHIATVN